MTPIHCRRASAARRDTERTRPRRTCSKPLDSGSVSASAMCTVRLEDRRRRRMLLPARRLALEKTRRARYRSTCATSGRRSTLEAPDLRTIGVAQSFGGSTMASSTGCSSFGEREMTASTSDVAVWYSRLSVSSFVRACTSSNNRDVLDGDDGLVGEGLDSDRSGGQ